MVDSTSFQLSDVPRGFCLLVYCLGMDESVDEIFEMRLRKNQREIDRIVEEVRSINHNLGLVRAALDSPDAKTIGETHGHLYDWSTWNWGQSRG